MAALSNRVFLSVNINGFELPDEALAVTFVHICSSLIYVLPIARLRFADFLGFFSQFAAMLGDANTVVIKVGTSKETATVYNFLLWSWNRISEGSGYTYTLDLIYNAPKYLVHTVPGSFSNQSSGKVLSQVAAIAGLKYDGDNTNDTQTWIGGHQRLAVFASKTASRGWVNGKSLMALAVDLRGYLRYRNLNAIPLSPFNFTHSPQAANDYQIVSEEISSNSGFQNIFRGYGHEVSSYDLLNTQQVSNSTVGVTKLSQTLQTNKDIHSGLVNPFATNTGTLDTSNVNQQYFVGWYQNVRAKAVFNLTVYPTVSQQTSVHIMDVCSLESRSSNAGAPSVKVKAFSGKYLTMSRAICVVNLSYYEKFALIRQGMDISNPQLIG